MSNVSAMTIFTTCKPFVGLDAVLQENAIRSWRALGLDVVILGTEPGVSEVCQRLGCTQVKEVEVGSKNLPLVSSIFKIAEKHEKQDWYAYLNSDIILGGETVSVLTPIMARFRSSSRVLITSRRKNIPLMSELSFDTEGWMSQLKELDDKYGTWDHGYAIDFFLFKKGWLSDVPDLLVGRAGWDNWMLHHAAKNDADIIDVSQVLSLYHPLHGYKARGPQYTDNRLNSESMANRSIIGKLTATIEGVRTHVATQAGILRSSETVFSEPTVDILKLFAADIVATKQLRFTTVDGWINHLCVLMSRALRYVPQRFTLSHSMEACEEAFREAYSLCAENNVNAAITYIQQFLLKEYISYLSVIPKRIYIWGTGAAGERLARLLKHNQIGIAGFVSTNAEASRVNIGGDEACCFSLKEYLEIPRSDKFIILASMYYDEMAAMLEEHSYQQGVDFIY